MEILEHLFGICGESHLNLNSAILFFLIPFILYEYLRYYLK